MPRGIAVNCLNPGPNDTGYADEESIAHSSSRNPRGRWGRPEDAARSVAWLVSDEADWIAGQVMASDGGWSIRPSWRLVGLRPAASNATLPRARRNQPRARQDKRPHRPTTRVGELDDSSAARGHPASLRRAQHQARITHRSRADLSRLQAEWAHG